jgi:hypothetical protein
LSLSCHKTIFRVDYKPSLRFYERLYSLAGSLSDYPDWFSDRFTVVLQKFPEHCNLRLGPNALVYVRDMKVDLDRDHARISEAVDLLASVPKEGNYARLGLRRQYLFPASMTFEELVILLGDRFLAQSPEIKKGICPAATDMSYVVVFEEETAKVRLAVGPMRRDELGAHLQPDMINFSDRDRPTVVTDLFKTYQDVNVFIDIDYFVQDLHGDSVGDIYRAALALHERLTENVVNYIFGLPAATPRAKLKGEG